jgi:phospholipid/cholesterol/gamma-HCH transport system ATP-binding protein
MIMTPKIRIRNLYKSFGSKHVLQGLSLDVMPGESVVIIGGSGSGKSVLLKCIIGLVTPDAGTIEIDGVDITHAKGKDRDVLLEKFGMLFQSGALFDSLPVWKNICFKGLQEGHLSALAGRKLAEETLNAVGLSKDVMDVFPDALSGGMKKRVGLGRAIAFHPEILFFDEPTTGLDPVMCGVIDNLIKRCVKTLGATGITITHDLTSARFIADKIAMIQEGVIIWEGPVSTLSTCKNKDVQAFIHGHHAFQQLEKQKAKPQKEKLQKKPGAKKRVTVK